jgi:hypothetical protein
MSKNMKKKFCCILEERSRIHDPYQNVTDPQHWKKQYLVSDYDIFVVLAGLRIRIRWDPH